MGGYNSSGHNRERVSVESCARVDVAMLRRAAVIRPSEPKSWQSTFSRRDTAVLVLNVTPTPETPQALHFGFVVPGQGAYSQIVPVSFTPCNYGKERAWLHCPKCARRVFRLFNYDHTWDGPTQLHYLACRHCWQLTYNLRRERGLSKYQSQTAKASDKLKHWAALHGDTDYIAGLKGLGWSELPPKPRWMRCRSSMCDGEDVCRRH